MRAVQSKGTVLFYALREREAKYKRETIGVNEDERDDQYNAGV